MTTTNDSSPKDMDLRVELDGKFFRVAENPFKIQGVTYGPFAPDSEGFQFKPLKDTVEDFSKMVAVGINALRVYTLPPGWLISAAAEAGIRLLVDIPWNPYQAFLDNRNSRRQILRELSRSASLLGNSPSIMAVSIANEIPPEVVRWHGKERVEGFLETACDAVKQVAPETLVTFGNYPSTEFLHPIGLDFATCNVYLHQAADFEAYLRRIHHRCGSQPLVVGEIGMDSQGEGETAQANFLDTHINLAFRTGVAGCFVFSWTDLWWKNHAWIEDWGFGITDRQGAPKAAFHSIQSSYQPAHHEQESSGYAHFPKVSVVVATHNGQKYLKENLTSLVDLDYPDYEILVIDDGSTDSSAEIARSFPEVKLVQQKKSGLSAARNLGIQESQGEWVAFTDDDCKVSRKWLHYAISRALEKNWDGIGGPNFAPDGDNLIASAVHLAPGAPTHVLLTDELAEHIPGCNMIFRKQALQTVGGFNPIFTTAGDDVDICWRLQESGATIGFSAAAYVWHHRRSSVRAYLKQQAGYGKAEAALELAHPDLFDELGRSQWKGALYEGGGSWNPDASGPVYGGPFGSAGFQLVYESLSQKSWNPISRSQIETWFFFHFPCWIAGFAFPLFWVLSLVLACYHLYQAWCEIPERALPPEHRKFWMRSLITGLRFFHPIYRGLSRYKERWRISKKPTPESCSFNDSNSNPSTDVEIRTTPWEFSCYRDPSPERFSFLTMFKRYLDAAGGVVRLDNGWANSDVKVLGDFWMEFRLNSMVELGEFNGGILKVKLTPSLRPPSLYFIILWTLCCWTLYWRNSLSLEALGLISFIPLAGIAVWLKRRAIRWRNKIFECMSETCEELFRSQ